MNVTWRPINTPSAFRGKTIKYRQKRRKSHPLTYNLVEKTNTTLTNTQSLLADLARFAHLLSQQRKHQSSREDLVLYCTLKMHWFSYSYSYSYSYSWWSQKKIFHFLCSGLVSLNGDFWWWDRLGNYEKRKRKRNRSTQNDVQPAF